MKGRGIGAVCAAAACAVALAAAPSAYASSTGNPGTDAQVTPGSAFDQTAQTFTVPAGTDDFLFRFEVLGLANDVPVTFTIQATAVGGQPTGPALWTSPVLAVDPAIRPVTLYPNLTVTPGVRYALVVDASDEISFLGTSNSSYPEGQLWSRNPPPPADNWASFNTFDFGFLAEFNTGQVATTTGVVCAPGSPPINSATSCTATLTVSGTGAPVSGEVIDFSTGANPNLGTCSTNASGECSISYTELTPGTRTVTGEFAGDGTRAPSEGTDDVTFTIRSIANSVSCTPSPLRLGVPASCTITVSDTSPGTPITPTGFAGMVPDQPGPTTTNPCSLSGGSCAVGYTPTTLNPGNINPVYSGDIAHGAANGPLTPFTVERRFSQTALACSPAQAPSGQPSTCTVTVTDSDPGTSSTPTGPVALSSSGAGSLSASSCTLSSGTCSVTYTPGGPGSSTITASYGGDGTHVSSDGDSTVTGVPQPSSCAKVQRKLNRLKKKLKRQQAGAGDSRKKARKRAKIKKNIADTKRRKRKRC
jgi:hypothetical protein